MNSFKNCSFFLIFFHLFAVVQATTCPHNVNSRIQECVQPVAEYAKVLNNQDPSTGGAEFSGAFSLPNMGGRVFNELCRLIAKFNSCVRDHRSICPRHVTISLIDSSYGYLCNEGYNTFMESAECLMELDRKPSVKKCHDETLKEIESANTESGISMSAKLDRMCGALNFFSGCVRSPIKQECGFSAWQVIYRVLKDTTNTLMPACQFTGTSQKLVEFQKQNGFNDLMSTKLLTTSKNPIKEEFSTKKSIMKTISTTTTPFVELIAYTTSINSEYVKHSMRKVQSSGLSDYNSNSRNNFFHFSFLYFYLAVGFYFYFY